MTTISRNNRSSPRVFHHRGGYPEPPPVVAGSSNGCLFRPATDCPQLPKIRLELDVRIAGGVPSPLGFGGTSGRPPLAAPGSLRVGDKAGVTGVPMRYRAVHVMARQRSSWAAGIPDIGGISGTPTAVTALR
jgi:hypothetical protein